MKKKEKQKAGSISLHNFFREADAKYYQASIWLPCFSLSLRLEYRTVGDNKNVKGSQLRDSL